MHSFFFCPISERYCGQECGQRGDFGGLSEIAERRNGFVMWKIGGGLWDSWGLICPKTAPIAVSKTDNVKIITPEANQFADAWDIDYRKYHDLFIPENKTEAIAVSISE